MDSRVPIPKIAVSSGQHHISRTPKACQPCRERKRKCSGNQPICRQCEEESLACVYRESKRQQTEKALRSLTSQLQICHELLREILPELGPDSARRVEAVLNKNATETVTDPISLPALVRQPNIFNKEVDSSNDMQRTVSDFTDEDFNRDIKTQATGFLGGHSEIAWLYRLRRELEQSRRSAVAGHDPVFEEQRMFRDSITTMSYSTDESDLPIDMNVDVFGVPPRKIADDLINDYLHIIHPSFPIISKTLFVKQFTLFYSKTDARPGKRWLAILNLILAIASRYRGLAYGDNGKGEHYNDLKYFCRAWKLNTADFALANHPDLQQVQVEGLTSFYLLSIGQVNRSWRFCGLSMRSAITMGIHLRNESPDVSLISKENRCWVWWSLYTLDITLCLKTGRGPSVNTDFITAPLPLPFGDKEMWEVSGPALIREYRDSSQLIGPHPSLVQHQQHGQNPEVSRTSITVHDGLQTSPEGSCGPVLDTSRYFLSFVQLTLLMRQSIESLYAPACSEGPWNVREEMTVSLNTKLDDWSSRLSSELQFENKKSQSDVYIRQRVSLAFRFYSTRILILQPCLRRATKQTSSELCEKLADLCVEAAYQMLSLFPDCPDTSWLYDISPWWCTLHYLMQSMIVFLMKLQHVKQNDLVTTGKLSDSMGKSVWWLREMSTRDPPSERAWNICKEIIMKHFPVYNLGANVTN